jgi:uncharacterized protein YkwD
MNSLSRWKSNLWNRRAASTAAALLVILISSSTALESQDLPYGCPSAAEVEVVRLLNEARASLGLRPVVLDARLVASAQLHSADMATNDFYDHVGSNGSRFSDRILAQGYPSPLGEMIAAAYIAPASVVNAWIASPPHYQLLTHPSATHVGTGYAFSRYAMYRHFWTVNFGRSSAAPQPAGADCGGVAFRRGDANGDGAVDIADSIQTLNHLYGRVASACRDAMDSNDSGVLDVGDPIHLLGYLFGGGPSPAQPFTSCGQDSVGRDMVGCAAYAGC